MKKILLFSLMAALFTNYTSAQTTKSGKKILPKKTVVKKPSKTIVKDTASGVIRLMSTSTNEANSVGSRLNIADPTIKAFNQKAAGADLKLSGSGIVGMPNGTYGFANGKIFLRSTTATSPGTAYGSGGVGTGTSINSIGTSEATIGVNGKSSYAGPWLWGSKQPVYNVAVGAKATTGKKQ